EIEKNEFDLIFHHTRKFLKEKNIKYLMLTLSEMGILICDFDNYIIVPAEKREIIDVSGAGDTVISMASICLAGNMEMKNIAVVSNLAGGLVCKKPGVVPIERNKLYQALLNAID
ncbi:PfkB family carbohydrate kinase, partial [Bacteroidota bacterium]